jgi:hypothetical protein
MFQNLKTDAELPFHCELWGMWSFQPSWLGMGWRRAAIFPNQDMCFGHVASIKGLYNINFNLMTFWGIQFVLCIYWACYRLGQWKNHEFISGRGLSFLFSKMSRLDVWPTQPPVQWMPGALFLGVNWVTQYAEPSPPSSAKVRNEWSCTSTPPLALVACSWQHYVTLLHSDVGMCNMLRLMSRYMFS